MYYTNKSEWLENIHHQITTDTWSEDFLAMDLEGFRLKLPPRLKLTFEFLCEGYTQKEVASFLKCCPQTITEYKRRIRKRLCQYFGLSPMCEDNSNYACKIDTRKH